MTTRGRSRALRVIAPAVLAVAAIGLVRADWLWRLDYQLLDLFQRVPQRTAPADVVLVTIDDSSLAEIGRWPWPRSVHAELIDRLMSAGARAVALDIAFVEPSVEADDVRLAQALRASGRVVLPVLHEQEASGAPVERLPVAPIAAAAAALGHVDVEVDPDGLARSVFLEAGLGRPVWPSLPLALLRLDAEAAPQNLPGEVDPDPTEPAPYAWVRDHRVLVAFSGPPGHFRRVSYADVLHDRGSAGLLRDAFVLVGPTATGLGDQVPTPVSGLDRAMSGIEFNANVFEALRRGTTIEFVPLGQTSALTGVLVFVIGVGLMLTRRHLLWAVVALAAVIGLSWVVLVWLGRWFTPTPALAATLLAYPLAGWWGRQRLVRSVERERARADLAFGSLAEGVVTADAGGRIDYLNPVADRWLGEGHGLGLDLASVLHLDTGDGFAVSLVEAGDGRPVPATLLTREGTRMPVSASVVVIGGPEGRRQGTVVALAARELPPAAAVADAASSRAGLDARLGRMIGEASRTGQQVAVLVLNISQLRHVNVAFGRKAGDALLHAVAERLRGATRKHEAVARVGGDEFVILLDELGRSADALALATRLTKALDQPFSVDGVEVRVRASVGVSIYPEHGHDAEILIQRAETARSWARDHEGAPVQLFHAHMSGPVLDRIVLEGALQAALEGDQLELVYQPQVEIASGLVVGAETLVRWQHPQLGAIPAVSLIALAERTQLIVELGTWVLSAACRQLAAWRAAGAAPARLAVNVSPRQFLQPDLVDIIDRLLRECRLPPSSLELEITENVLMDDLAAATATLTRIKAMGVAIALDDFGVGYSSLGYLSRFPVDCVKIDRSFVDNVTVDGHDRTICLAVLAMAQSMHRRVVAEGVETLEQMQFLAAKGCDLVQGYYISRPVGAAEIERLVRDRVTFRTS